MEAHQIPKWVQGSVTSRIKIMASMDIAEKRIPQDGRIRITMAGRELDLRVSTLPTQYGEKIVLRVLDSNAALLNLEDIGLKKNDYFNVSNIIKKPQGILLVTGPTGSGKSSTLHAITSHIKTETINIVALEDPIELEHKGVNQVAINERTGLTFAHGLRSILRQDPDVIMVGEMRDSETASIAIQASITGHLVLTTLHTNTAVAAITRLKNLGIPPYLIASSLNGVIAQRLVRKLCDRCKKAFSPTEEELIIIGFKQMSASHLKFYKEVGCESCGNTGYRGRIGVFEILIINTAIRKLIANNAIEDVILKASLDIGMKCMSEDGIEKVKAGVTSINELTRVLYVTDEEAINICPDCSETVRHDFLICPYCSYLLVNECLNCGKPREREWKYCPFCRDEFA
jgi:type IV pilus assembly protein PilB